MKAFLVSADIVLHPKAHTTLFKRQCTLFIETHYFLIFSPGFVTLIISIMKLYGSRSQEPHAVTKSYVSEI